MTGTDSTPKPLKFSQRQRRALDALRGAGWVSRETLDRATGCSNGPDVIARLREKLGRDAIDTRLVDATDRDGRPCKPGQYRLTDKGRARLVEVAHA